MSLVNIPRVTVSIHRPRSVSGVLALIQAVRSKVGASPLIFKTPDPPLATIDAHVADLQAAQTASLTTKGGVQVRDVKLQVVVEDLHIISAYVERSANADPTNAAAIVAAANLTIKKSPVRNKQDLAVKQGPVSGSVILEAKAAAPRASYEWQTSLDQKAWSDLPGTLQARTSVVGLGSGLMHYFRVQALTRTGTADWSQVVGLLVK